MAKLEMNSGKQVEIAASTAPKTESERKPFFDKNKRPHGDRGPKREEKKDDLERKLVQINRVTKVVKGGKTMRFSALVVVGDQKGMVGIGTGKAAEVPSAVEKAVAAAKNNMIKISLQGNTIPHEVIGSYGTSKVILIPAPEGRGVIAGGSARAVLELVGIKDISCKSYGSRNKINNVRACLDGLTKLKTKEQLAAIRGIQVEEV